MATILIVDDRPVNRKLLIAPLGHAGHRPLEAGSGQEGLVIAQAEHPDLIIIDIIMPAMDGYEFALLLRADPQLRHTRVVFYTPSPVVAETRPLAGAVGVAHIIPKSAEPKEILHTVDLALRSEPPALIAPPGEAFHQAQMRLLTQALAANVEELDAENAASRRVTKELAASESELRALFASMSDVIAVLDADGTYLKIAPTKPRPAYLAAPQLIGRRLHDSFPPQQADVIVTHIRQALAMRQAVTFDYSMAVDGETVWFEATITPMSGARVYLAAREVSAHRLPEPASLDTEVHLGVLFANAPISIWEEDFSEVKQLLDQIPAERADRIGEYLSNHPEVEAACLRLVKVIDVNQASLELLAVAERASLTGGLAANFAADSRAFQQELIAIQHGERKLKLDATLRTRTGEQRIVTLFWAVVPGHEQDYSRVLVSLVDITERKRAEEQTQRQLARVNALRTIDQSINASLDLQTTLQVVLDQVVAQLDVDGADVFLLNAAAQSVDYAAGRGFRSEIKPTISLPLGQEYAGRVALERRTLAVPDFEQHRTGALRVVSLYEEGFRAYFGVPLIAKDQVRGVLEVFHRSPLHPDQDWLDFLEGLAGQAAIAIDKAALFNDVQQSNRNLNLAYDATIEGWSRALDLRDRETYGHSQRVTDLSVRLAARMGLAAEQLVAIRRGALLHDIGKMGIPDQILLKPGPLSEEEWIIMRQHPGFAYDLLTPIHYLRPAIEIPYCHHEKWDGTGYPRKLKGEQIPLAARIFAVVDEWDALRSDRPYRRGWAEADVRGYIRNQAGAHFDPDVVAVFEQLMHDER